MILTKPVMVSASRAVGFPNLIAQANPVFDYRTITGRFVIDHIEQLKRVEAVAPAYVAIESIGPRLRVNLNNSGTIQHGLYNGISAKDANNVVYASSGVDDSLGGRDPFVHVRGYLVDENHLELLFFQSQYGMVGPISAHRDKDPLVMQVPPNRGSRTNSAGTRR